MPSLALWFHDAIYGPRRDDNEARSADWARSVAGEEVAALVMATRHAQSPESADARLVADADLWILAAPKPRFDEYQAQIREEYAWMPEADYRRGRTSLLQGFLERETIYGTEHFARRYEKRARANLTRALDDLRLGLGGV